MSALRFLILASGATLVFSACRGAPAGDSLTVAVRDSAGIEIAEISGDPWSAPPWAVIDSARAVRILPDSANPATLFGRVRGALRLRDGSFAVLDAANYEVRYFDAGGTFMRKFGRRGQGPGEFELPWRLLHGRGDSIVVAELNNGTIQVFSTATDSSRFVRVPVGTQTGSAHLLGAFADGDFLVIMNDLRHEPQPGRNPLHSSLHVMKSDGGPGPDLGTQISTEQVFRDSGGGRLVQVENLFWAEPGWAGLSDSYAWCLPREFECDIWSKQGTHTRIIRADVRGAPVPASAYAELEAQRLRDVTEQSDSARIRRGMEQGDRPEVFPVLSLIRGDSRDRIWMREYLWRNDATAARWLVFESSTGRVLGTVTLPADMWIYEIGENHILGTETDENDVQHVVMYPYGVLSASPG